VILESLAAEVPVMASPVGEIGNFITMVSEDTDEYVRRILKGGWVLDGLPNHIEDTEEQKKEYLKLINMVI
jgi:hypothetical protein